MTMHQYFVTFRFLNVAVHQLDHGEDLFVRSDLQVLPVGVEVSDARIVDQLRVVTETDLVGHEAIAAEWVLSRLFTIKDSDNLHVLHLLKHVEFFDLSVTQSGRSD